MWRIKTFYIIDPHPLSPPLDFSCSKTLATQSTLFFRVLVLLELTDLCKCFDSPKALLMHRKRHLTYSAPRLSPYCILISNELTTVKGRWRGWTNKFLPCDMNGNKLAGPVTSDLTDFWRVLCRHLLHNNVYKLSLVVPWPLRIQFSSHWI